MIYLIFPFLTTAAYYLGSRAMITSFLWTRYPLWLDNFLSCAACSGTHYGIIVGTVAYGLDIPFLGSTHWLTIPVIGLASMIWTPILAALHESSIYSLSTPTDHEDSSRAVPTAIDDQSENPVD